VKLWARVIRFLLTAAAVAAVAACASGPAAAPPQPAAPVDPSMASPPPTNLRGYLAPADLDSLQLLGPPPAPDSPRGQADRATYLETRALADSPRWREATQDNDLWYGGAMHRFACAAGVEISARSTPATHRLLERVELDVRTVGTPVKARYNRTRPMIGDERPICVRREDWMKTNGSYPSGHASTGWAWGLILGELAPAKASALVAAGREIGDSRTICGVHYQSDVEAGRTLAAALVARLHGSPEFRRELERARSELARAKAPPGNCPA
jgi:acid phosphatase (class A)